MRGRSLTQGGRSPFHEPLAPTPEPTLKDPGEGREANVVRAAPPLTAEGTPDGRRQGHGRIPPVERVRARLRREGQAHVAALLPKGYQRLHDVLLIRLPLEALPFGAHIGSLYREEFGVATVLAIDRVQKGSRREPHTHLLAGERTETVIRDGEIQYVTDAAQLLYSAGNMEERHRVAALIRPGERVADLFAGIGYFAIPIAKVGHASVVYAVDKNPKAFHYLERNIAMNQVPGIVVPLLGDNREVPLPTQSFDRILLGYLPSALPYVGRALELLSPSGGWVHVHTVSSTRIGAAAMLQQGIREAVARAGRRVEKATVRRIKSYAPCRVHLVVNVRIG